MRHLYGLMALCVLTLQLSGCSSSDSSSPSDLAQDGSSAGPDVGGDAALDGDTASTDDTGAVDTGTDVAPADTTEEDADGPAVCGNGRADDGEACDGVDTRGLGCTAVGFTAGDLGCRADCAAFDTTGCSNDCVPDCTSVQCGLDPTCGTLCGTCPEGSACDAAGQCVEAEGVCGNGARERGELCDGTDITETCATLGFDSGTLGCAGDCQSYVFDACAGDVEAVCGNSTREPGELCDGSDLNGADCTDFSFDTGVLSCASDCGSYVFSGCTNVVEAVCGNGTREGGEICDRGDLGGNTCISLGYDRGALSCSADCSALVTTGCASDCVPTCGTRDCGPDPTCGISCGTCGAGESCSSGTCQSDGPRGPRIITFNTNALEITDDENVVFTAVVTDPDGIDDVIGGTLIDPATGRSYGSFATAASEGAYSLTLTWADIQRVRPINFTTVDETRVFRASFFDVSGESATAEVELTLTCEGLGACDGVCTNITTSSNCGTCGTRCLTGGVCTAGVCGCPAGYGGCDGACTLLSTTRDCGACDNTCVSGQTCEEGACECAPGRAVCGSTCRTQSTTARCGADGCTACGATQTCFDNTCTAPTDGALRLLGEASILQVYHLGTWNSVCDNAFSESEGIVACRQMGMGYVEFTPDRSLSPFVGYRLDDLPCNGSERSLTACYPLFAWDPTGCFSTDHVSLICDPTVAPTAATCPPRPAGSVVLNEVLFNPPGADGTGAAEWIELYGTPNLTLKNYTLVGYDGATGNAYFRQPLDGQYLRSGGFLLVEGATGSEGFIWLSNELQNGPDSLRLEYCDGTVVDALAYGTFGAGTTARGEGTPEPAPATETSVARVTDGVDTNNNSADWQAAIVTSPGRTNAVFDFPLVRTGNVTTSSPTFVRPAQNCAGSTTTSYYQVIPVTNLGSTTLSVTITADWSGDIDGFLAVYRGAFTPSTPLSNCLGADDDGTGTSDSIVTIPSWGPGQTLNLVATSWNALQPVGSFQITITNP
jgi:hypothetical protein